MAAHFLNRECKEGLLVNLSLCHVDVLFVGEQR